MKEFGRPPSACSPVKRNVNDEECRPWVSTSKRCQSLFWRMTFTSTKYIEKSSCHDRDFPFTVRYESNSPYRRAPLKWQNWFSELLCACGSDDVVLLPYTLQLNTASWTQGRGIGLELGRSGHRFWLSRSIDLKLVLSWQDTVGHC